MQKRDFLKDVVRHVDIEAFDARLPFELTPGQVAVSDEVFADLARDRPMQRLLQGEVGSGKTLVALIASRQ